MCRKCESTRCRSHDVRCRPASAQSGQITRQRVVIWLRHRGIRRFHCVHDSPLVSGVDCRVQRATVLRVALASGCRRACETFDQNVSSQDGPSSLDTSQNSQIRNAQISGVRIIRRSVMRKCLMFAEFAGSQCAHSWCSRNSQVRNAQDLWPGSVSANCAPANSANPGFLRTRNLRIVRSDITLLLGLTV